MATTKKFIKSAEKLGKEVINLGFYPMPYDYEIVINSKKVGAVLDNCCYLIFTPSLNEILPNAEIVPSLNQGAYDYIEFGEIENSELWQKCLKAVYHDLYYGNEYVVDFFGLYESYQNYPNDIMRCYDRDVLFLKFCYEHKLLKRNPLDNKERIIHSRFTRQDLTELGNQIFDKLHHKFLVYSDRTQKPNFAKMLTKWFDELTNQSTQPIK